MKILRLRIENLNSLRLKKTIDFSEAPLSDTGLFAITGDTGAGKTTILDAITLALYGKVHRNKEVTEVMSYGATESLAEVEFESPRGLFRAKWSTYRSHKKPDGNIQPPRRELAEWDEQKKEFRIIAEKIREVDAIVEEVSGLDYDRFTRSVLLSQGDFAAFLQAGERERSDLLERITGTEVYTRISMAAYERYREEQNKLEDLRRQQQAMHLLSQEELETIQAELEEKNGKAGKVRKELEQLREQVQWYQLKNDLEKNKGELLLRQSELQQKKEAFEPQAKRLEAHRRAWPHHRLLEKNEEAATQLETLARELSDLQGQEDQLKTALQEEEAKLQIELEAQKELALQKKKLFPVFDLVLNLDEKLKSRKENLAQLKQESTALMEELRSLKQKQTGLKKQLADNEGEVKDLVQWLNARADWAQLAVLLPEIDRKRDAMSEIIRQQKQLEDRKKALEKEKQDLEKGHRRISENLTARREELERLQQEFQKDLPEGYTLNRNELLRVLLRDIEQLGEQQKQLQQLHQFNLEYQGLLSELSEYENQMESLTHQEAAIDKAVISSMDTLDWAGQQLEYRREIYEQQQLIANYEKDRHQLKEGDPCPLCLSVHHPFRDHPVRPFVDQARLEFEKIKKSYESLLQKHNELMNQQREIKIQKEQLIGNELQELGGQMARQLRKVEQIEERVADMILGFKEQRHGDERGPELESKIAEATNNIDHKKKIRDRLLKLSEQLDAEEEKVQTLETELQESHSGLQVLAEKVSSNTLQLEEVAEKYRILMSEVAAVFHQYGRSIETEGPKAAYQALKKDHESFTGHTEKRKALEQQIALDRQNLQNQEERESQDSVRLAKFQSREKELETEFQNLLTKRRELLEDKDPQREKDQLEQALDLKNEQVTILKDSIHELKTQWKAIGPLQKEKQKNQKKLQKEWDEGQDQLNKAAAYAGFAGPGELAAALLEAEIADDLTNQQGSLEREELNLRQSMQDLEKSLQKLLQVRQGDTPLEDLQNHLENRESDFQALQQTIGALNERLGANEKQQKAAGKIVGQIAAQEKEFARWARLNEVIGQADGKKFRIFAQGLTLSKLVELANYHLDSLNGRYLIRKRGDDNLELEIIDTFQADNARSMNTLSGGESFLVSLALALGLSDLAGRDARIRSLFIDEGFGTLDENSLDMAIDTLENLQSNGKSIGIISHVKALKERIGTQILVTKQGTGFSEIAIVG